MAVYRLLEHLLAKGIHAWSKKPPKCESCKTAMEKEDNPLLCLLPVSFDKEYTPSPAYYQQNCRPIRHVGEIPTGQRACHFWTLTCPQCGQHKILVEDFLQVRNEQVVESRQLYPYGELDLIKLSGF